VGGVAYKRTTVLTACGQSAPTDTVESLAANLERLKELRAQCKADHAKLGDALCNAAAGQYPLSAAVRADSSHRQRLSANHPTRRNALFFAAMRSVFPQLEILLSSRPLF
jgi:hypothetical protein